MSEQSPMPPQCQGGSGCTCCGPDCDCGCIEKCPAYKRLSAVYVPPRNQKKTMMSEIQAGDGFRLIDNEKDTPKLGDQFHNGQAWFDRPSPLTPFSSFDTYRRRIPAKPEAMEIETEVGLMRLDADSFGHVFIGQRREYLNQRIRLDKSEQIRQVIAWLQQVADWREEQEATEKGSN
jgi:hypothetical protein